MEAFYIKRFSFDVSDNTPVSFISDTKGSFLVAVSDDRHPQVEVIFGGKYEHREAEKIDAEEFIGKKGIQAKGKKASQYDIKDIKFIEPLRKPEDDITESEPEVIENQAGEIDNSDVEDPIDIDADDDQLTLF